MDEKREILEILLDNARTSVDDIARQLDLNADEVETVIESLENSGIVRGYQAIVDWDRYNDEHVQAAVELNVKLDRETSYQDIARRIAKFPEVSTLRLVSGEHDFAVDIEGESMHMISDFVSQRIAPIPEITKTVTHFVMDTYKDRGIELQGDGDDDRLSVSP